MKKTARIAAVFCAAVLTLTACGDRPDDEATDTESSAPASETAAAVDYKACMVSDSGGFDDKSFNQTSFAGLTNAAANLGVQTAQVESASDAEYADNIDALIAEGCNQITTVGFLLGDATLAAAKATPDVDFSIVDYAYFDDAGNNVAPANLKGLVFNTGEPSLLAGYIAAAKSESGVVGTLGGLNIPTVTAFMTGFRLGVELYNKDNDADVQVLGWNGKEGSFTEDFEDKTKGQAIAQGMIDQGADVIMPVAGASGLGALQAMKDAGGYGIWVDTDGCVSAAEYCDMLLTSVMKGLDTAVEDAITSGVEGTFSNELYVGTLENGGVGLAPFNAFEAEMDDAVVARLEELKASIASGETKVG